MEPIFALEQDCKQFPAQYTVEWFSRTGDSVGGSEMHDLMIRPLVLTAKKICNLIAREKAAEAQSICATALAQSPVLSSAIISTTAPATAPAPAPAPKKSATSLARTDEEFVMVRTGIASSSSVQVRMDCAEPKVEPEIITIPINPKEDIKAISMSGDVAMAWGTLFEPVLCNYVAQQMGLPIYCRSVSYFKDPFRFSPDGIFCDSQGQAALLEMKNPFLRVWPTFNISRNNQFELPHSSTPCPGEVPSYYVPQLQLGMYLLPFLQYSYYVEAIFRRANTRGMSCAIGLQKMRDVRDAPIMENGVIGFYHSSGTGNLETAYDFRSTANDIMLCNVLTHQRSNDGSEIFIPLYFPPTEPEPASAAASASALDSTEASTEARAVPFIKMPKELPLTYDNKPLFGYMTWNLLGVHTVRMERDPQFMTETMCKNATFVATYARNCFDMTFEQRIDAMRKLCDIAALSGSNQVTDIEKMISGLTKT